ncbi:MAG: diguanylate cyclase [Candidatus Omnitrophota bacterium]
MGKNNNLSSAKASLKYKLKISFYLMSILPLLICIYLVSNYIFPRVGVKADVAISVAISVFIAGIGFFVIKQVFDRILSVSTEAKLIAAGDITRKISVSEADEVTDLGEALNQLTGRIRSNMDELKSYSERTTEINLEIQKRVLVLSSLLQISSLIAQGARLEDILKLTTGKARLLASSDVAYLLSREESQEAFTMKIAEGIDAGNLLKVTLKPEDGLFSKFVKSPQPFVIDKENRLPQNLALNLDEKFGLKNTLAIPIFLRGRITAVLGIGNAQGGFSYNKQDLELLDIFAKQVAIAIENDILVHRVEKLEIKDALTGLYNEAFIRSRLQEEIKRAITYQRPCAFIVFDIDNFKQFHEAFGSIQAEAALKKMASLIRDSVTEIDRVARIGDDAFAVVLPEKNKRQAQSTAEDIRKKIAFAFNEEQDQKKRLTVSGAISENPLDGIEAEELISKAKELVKIAKAQGKNRIAGFGERA